MSKAEGFCVVFVEKKGAIHYPKWKHNLTWLNTFFLFQSRTPALVFEHVNNTDFKVQCGM